MASLYYSTLAIPRDRLKSHYRFGNLPFREFMNLQKGYETISEHHIEQGEKGPEIEPEVEENAKPKYKYMQHVSLVIACHESEDKIRDTLRAAISAGFLRRNIYIAHNSRQAVPIDKTGVPTWDHSMSSSPSSVHTHTQTHPPPPPPPSDYPYSSVAPSPVSSSSIPPPHDCPQDSSSEASVPLSSSTESQRNPSDMHGVRYVYIPIGNKTTALHYVIHNYVTTPLVMIIDDDVMLPPNIDMEGAYNKLQDDNMKAIAFTIRGIDDANIWQSFQHLEYMQAGFVKIFQADYGSVLTCHGAIALWKTDTINYVLLKHNTEFDGEDLQMGLILRRMNKGYTIGVNAVEPVPTTAPRSLIWEPTPKEKSLMVQRIFSWDMAAHHYILDFMEILLLNWEKKSLILKPFLITELWTQFQDWLRIIFLIDLIINHETSKLITAFAVLLGIQYILVFVFDRVVIAHRPMLQISGFLLMLYPIYNVICLGFRFGGLLVNIFYYTPWNPPRITIQERYDRGELPPKVEIDNIPDDMKESYWNTVWKNPQEAYNMTTM